MNRFAACFIAAALAAAAAKPARAITAIYSFGDSLSDVGNDYVGTGGLLPAPPYFAGRFSNGPNWLDDLASYYGLSPLLPSLAPGGTDYAFGGARSGPNTIVPPSGFGALIPPSVDQQIGLFEAAHPAGAPAGALYTVWSGANDILQTVSAFAGDHTTNTTSAITQAADDELAAIQALVADGATDLLVVGNPDIGRTPSLSSTALAGLGTSLTQEYNGILQAGLAGFGAKVTYLDLFPLIQDAPAYGFADNTTPCYTGTYTNSNFAALCSTNRAVQDTHLFFDTLHPTEAGFAVVADLAEVALPEPGSLSLLGLALAGTAALRLRRGRAI